MTLYQHQPTSGFLPNSEEPPHFALHQPAGPSAAYASSQPLIEDDFRPYSWADKGEYGGPLEIRKKSVNDIAFLILFIMQFCGFVAISTLVLGNLVKEGGLGGTPGGGINGSSTKSPITLDQHAMILLLFVTAAGLALAVGYLVLVRAFTKTIMHVTLILSVLLNIGICVYYWVTRYYPGAMIFTVITIFSVLAYFHFRARIPMATLFLQVVMDVSKHHLSVYVVALVAVITQAMLAVWFSCVVIATYVKYPPDTSSCSTDAICLSGTLVGLVLFELFSFLWTSQVIGNVALATLAGGPYGAWYYFGPRWQGNMPAHPTLSAFSRACTLSLGSIAFGSLIVTMLEFIRLILRVVRQNSNTQGHPVQACLACCAECFVGFVESLMKYFNRYAYIEIALYGKPYIEAAQDTWRLFKDRGIHAIINDSLVGIILTWGACVVGLLSALFGCLYLHFMHPAYDDNGQYAALVVFAFVIGLTCSLTLSSAIEAGVSTIFVGVGEDPQVLAERAPYLFEMIQCHYPQVVQTGPGDQL